MEHKMTEEVRKKIGDAQPVNCTISRTPLSATDDPSPSGPLPAYSVRHDILKNIFYALVIDFYLPLGLCNESLEQPHKTNSNFLQATCIDHRHWASVLFSYQDAGYVQDFAWL